MAAQVTGGREKDEPDELISVEQLLRSVDRQPEPGQHYPESDEGDTVRLPNITRMPKGTQVRGRRIGRAVGHWVLQVRCECGRRWFEIEQIETAECPRCGALVAIEVEPR
jgi:hypothetical protein